MKTTKKVIGIVLALAMLVGVFSMMSFAGGTDSAIDLYIAPDKTSYSAGDEVVLTVSEQVVAAVGDMQIAGQYAVAYNDAIFSPYASTNELVDHGFVAIQAGWDSSISGVTFHSAMVEQGDSVDATGASAYNWNKIIMYNVASDGTTFAATNKTDLFTVKLKLNAGIPDGDYVIGFNQPSYENYIAYSVDNKNGGFYGYTDDYGTGTKVNYSFGTCTIHVGAATPSYSVAKFKSEAFFTGNKTAAPDDLFNYRLTSVITNADLTAMNTGSNKITKVGFIAANTGAADAAAAQAAVEAGTTLPTAWKSASTDYISCTDTATADAYFGAIIKNISHAAQATDIDCYAYVCYNDGTADHYVWYTAAAKAAVSTGYDAAVTYWQTH